MQGEISIISDMQMTPPLWQKEKKNYLRLLMKVKEKSEKVGLKFNLKKLISWHPIPLLHGKLMGKQLKRVTDFISLGPRITTGDDCSHEINRSLFLGRNIMTKLDSVLRSRDITLPMKVHLVKAIGFSSGYVWV